VVYPFAIKRLLANPTRSPVLRRVVRRVVGRRSLKRVETSVESAWCPLSRLRYDQLLSSVAYNFDSRLCRMVSDERTGLLSPARLSAMLDDAAALTGVPRLVIVRDSMMTREGLG
jgi:hypothetical protein